MHPQLERGIRLFEQGRHTEAQVPLRKAATEASAHARDRAEAFNVLGLIAAQQRRFPEAEQHFRQCVAIDPGHAEGHNNLGNVLLARGDAAGAEQVYLDAARRAPNYAPAWFNLGNCRRSLGRLDEAVTAYRQALAVNSGYVEAKINLGSTLREAGDYDGAESIFTELLGRYPDFPEFRLNLANTYRSRGALGKAKEQYSALLEKHADMTRAKVALAMIALDENHLETAEQLIEQVQDAEGLPRHERLAALAALKMRQGDVASAAAVALQSVQAGANSPDHLFNLAQLLSLAGHLQESVRLREQILARFGERPRRLLGELVADQFALCDWSKATERLPSLVEFARRSDREVVEPFTAIALPVFTPADLLRIARIHARQYDEWGTLGSSLRSTATRPAQRLRIGYLSADFQDHATAWLTASVFELHDRDRFEVFAYSYGPSREQGMQPRLRRAFEHFVEIQSLSHVDAAQRIRDDGIQILVDMKGYTRAARPEIMAQRPAPLQAAWLGFPGTLGASFIDYQIVDPVVAPPEATSDFDERLAYLPDCYAPVDFQRDRRPPPTRAEAGLPETGFVFCCFNAPYKITPEVFAIWCDLLREVPDSVLWLQAKNEPAQANLIREAGARGIGAERLVFAPQLPHADHLARIMLADLFLDTTPVNAHTTASDALWAGVPVLTWMGDRFASRVAASLLSACNLPELIARRGDEYRARALDLATHPERLAALRARLAAARTSAPYFDTPRFTRNLEALFERMWERHARGLPPDRLDPSPPDTRN